MISVKCSLFLSLLTFASSVSLAQKPELVVQRGHTGGVSCIAFSPDDRILASGSADKFGHGEIKLWDAGTGKELRTLTGNSDPIRRVAFSPDGKVLVSSSESGIIKSWEVATGTELSTLSGPFEGASLVALSSDGKLGASVDENQDEAIKVWNVVTGKQLRILTHAEEVNSFAFSPDGKVLASGSSDTIIKLWNVATGAELRTLTGHAGVITSLVFGPDGKIMASVDDEAMVKLWDVITGKQLRILTRPGHEINFVAFSPDGKILASVAVDMTIKLWSITTGKELLALPRYPVQSGSITSVAFSSDSKTLAGGTKSGLIKLWNVTTSRELRTLTRHSQAVSGVAFSPDGRILASGSEYTTSNPQGNILAGGIYDYTVKLWDVTTGKELRTLAGHSKDVFSVAFSPDNKTIASGSVDRTIKLWDLATGKELHKLTGHSDAITSVKFSPDSKILASGGFDKTVRLWDVATGKEPHRLIGHSMWSINVAFSPDGKTLASGSEDATIILWDVATAKPLRTLTGHRSAVNSVAFSPDGSAIASGSMDQTIKLWDLATGKELHTFSGNSGSIGPVVFSRDGRVLVAGSESGVLEFWDVAARTELRSFTGHSERINGLAFSPDGNILASGSVDTKIKLWEASTGKELISLIALDQKDWVVLTPDGRFDASPDGMNLLHWVVGIEPIDLEQLKDAYYEPGLLSKLLGFSKEPLRQIKPLKDVKLYPEIVERKLDQAIPRLTVKVKNRGGGIGPVLVSVNGKTVVEDARDEQLKANPFVTEAVITVDLNGSPFISGHENEITVITNNYDSETKKGYISSRGTELAFVPEGQTKTEPPTLFAIVGGVSDYAGVALHLSFAAKDAEDFATALKLGARRLFGAEKTHITSLSTSKREGTIWPSKHNFKAAFAEVAKLAKPEDILVIYLAGHGVTLGLNSDTYLYLTQDATSLTKESLSNPDVRETTAISSAELIQWLAQTEWVKGEKGIKALKQVMILDTCAAGTAAGSLPLIARRDLTSDQIRAIERLKDRTGFHVLMGSAADAPSYEASQYGQGLLTYTLLQGMRGTAALRDGEFIDVQKLFQYAADQVPLLAKNIGGVQRPIVAAPSGTSFDMGQLNEDDRKLVPLTLVKPLILRPLFFDAQADDDTIGLMRILRALLRDESFITGRGASEGGLVFVDDEEFPGGIRPTGRYTVEGNRVTVTLRLRSDGKEIATAQVTGTKDDVAAKVIEAIKAAIRKP